LIRGRESERERERERERELASEFMSEWVRMEQEVSFVCLVHGYKSVDRSKL